MKCESSLPHTQGLILFHISSRTNTVYDLLTYFRKSRFNIILFCLAVFSSFQLQLCVIILPPLNTRQNKSSSPFENIYDKLFYQIECADHKNYSQKLLKCKYLLVINLLLCNIHTFMYVLVSTNFEIVLFKW
jgi:uncharacterized membrane protein YagU involved in acid resistance